MQKGFTVLSQVGQEFDHVLEVAFSFDGIVHIGAAAFQFVTAGGVLNDLPLLHRFDQSVVDTERDTVAVGKLREDGLFLGGGRILADHPHASVAVAHDIMVGKKLNCAGQNHVEEVLCADFFHLLRRKNFRGSF